jgi:hypothetical protein
MNFRPVASIVLLALACLSASAFADPSGRVGRISATQGPVTFRDTTTGNTDPATLNWPITSNNNLITDSGARAEFRVGSAAIRLDSNTDLEIVELDDTHFRLRLNRGSVTLHIRNAELARDIELATPQGHVLFAEPSNVRVDARYDTPVTTVNVYSGTVSFDGDNGRFTMPAGRRAEIAGGEPRLTDLRSANAGDDFDVWSSSRDRQDDRSVSVRYLSEETTGYEELDTHGAWRDTSQYGPVWSPRVVPAGWAPYRDGRWIWIAPWGWTWVDNAPWGYAPSHYGRWVWLDQRWCWTPGQRAARPVWAPALVGWVGGGNVQVRFSNGPAPAVGWFPLAPRETYVPAYRVSPTYVQQINNTYIINGRVDNHRDHDHDRDGRQQVYQNRYVNGALTVMPHDQFSASKTVLVKPSQLNPDQAGLLRTAPISAVTPLVTAPQAVATPSQPAYRQRGTPLTGPIMQTPPGRVGPAPAMIPAQGAPSAPARGQPNQRDVARQPDGNRIEATTPQRIVPVPPALGRPEHREEGRQGGARIELPKPQPASAPVVPAPLRQPERREEVRQGAARIETPMPQRAPSAPALHQSDRHEESHPRPARIEAPAPQRPAAPAMPVVAPVAKAPPPEHHDAPRAKQEQEKPREHQARRGNDEHDRR